MNVYARTIALALACCLVDAAAIAQPAAVSTRHPLDPLTVAEISAAVAAVKTRTELSGRLLFPLISLQEPSKDEVRAFKPGVAIKRHARVVVLDQQSGRSFEALVDLGAKSVVSMTQIEGAQPLVTLTEMLAAGDAIRKDPRWQAAMTKRGITRFDEVMIDTWAPGLIDAKTEPATHRLVRGLSYLKDKNRNQYARPIEGVVVVFDLTANQVERVIDLGVRPIPGAMDLPVSKNTPATATPAAIDGLSQRGKEIRWHQWRFRWSIDPRDGLVLHTVGWEEGGRVRPILHRASLSEMLVPYADPESTWSFRNAFDAGEYGIGRLTSEMEPGTDAPARAQFLQAAFADDSGKPYTMARAAALFERDGGVLWKHYQFDDGKSGTNYSRRSRELVLSWIATVGNYDYGLNWIFRRDGTIELEAFLTGIMLAKGVDATTEEHANGGVKGWHLVGPNVAAPHHQHFFNFRLDFDVDGSTPNAIREVNVRAEAPGPSNPDRNLFVMEENALRTELDAQRDLNLATSRKWLVVNPRAHNALGQPTGYVIVPGESGVPYLHPESPIRRRAAFINHHFWATAFAPNELNAAGTYPNQSSPGEGLPKWTAANRPLEGADVVVWYTFAVTHIPRPEEWPIMSSHKTGFKLLPVSFFSSNPSLGVPKR